MKRIITYLLLISTLLPAFADERPTAIMKVEYETTHLSHNIRTGKPIVSTDKYLLQIAPGSSYYYDPQTYLIDSLDNDPNGRIALDRIRNESYEECMKTGKDAFEYQKEKGIMRNKRYKCLKDFNNSNITIWDSSMGDKYRYEVAMDDLNWELGDSIKEVMGYECHSATADYHGRHWTAWFAPELAIQDGPWQLCGLPGLIMEAYTDDGSYRFDIKGLQSCNEVFKDPYEDEKYFHTKRTSFLKMKDYSRRNRSAQISAMTKGKVTLNGSVNYTGTDDYIETDYHE